MKILFLVNIPSPYRVDFFNELGELCDLTVLYERKIASDRNENWVSNKTNSFKEIFLKGINVRKDAAFNPGVIKYLKKGLFDLIVIGGYSTPTGMFAIEYCNLKKIPFILNADGGIINQESNIKFKIKKRYISKANAWLSTGINTSNYLTHYGAKSETIYHYPFTSIKDKDITSSALSSDAKSNIKNKLGLQNKPTAIAVGRFIHTKGFDVLIESWKNVQDDYNLLIIGEGEKKDELNEQIKSLNLNNVKLLDFMKTKDLEEYYKASDIFILPTRGDVWGLVINEAMACGLPIITTDKCVAGLELVTNNENGFIIPVDDGVALALRVNELLKNSELREVMGRKSIEKIKMYTVENMAEQHLNIFKTINFINEYDNYYVYE